MTLTQLQSLVPTDAARVNYFFQKGIACGILDLRLRDIWIAAICSTGNIGAYGVVMGSRLLSACFWQRGAGCNRILTEGYADMGSSLKFVAKVISFFIAISFFRIQELFHSQGIPSGATATTQSEYEAFLYSFGPRRTIPSFLSNKVIENNYVNFVTDPEYPNDQERFIKTQIVADIRRASYHINNKELPRGDEVESHTQYGQIKEALVVAKVAEQERVKLMSCFCQTILAQPMTTFKELFFNQRMEISPSQTADRPVFNLVIEEHRVCFQASTTQQLRQSSQGESGILGNTYRIQLTLIYDIPTHSEKAILEIEAQHTGGPRDRRLG